MCEVASIPPAECVPPSDLEESGFIALVKTLDVEAVMAKLPAISDIAVANGQLDAQVVGDEAAKAWLLTDNAKSVAGDVDWEHK